jgi:hypothetical protein
MGMPQTEARENHIFTENKASNVNQFDQGSYSSQNSEHLSVLVGDNREI